ncbi:hypothetical protein CIK05_07705 [Bdellovibrio sp. qaytius]|nr:hypothetical protein CIK05_07705 [Bdellovibrio sp. qaytius]
MKNKIMNLFMLVSFLPVALFAADKIKKNSKVILSGNLLANPQVVPVGGQAKTVMASGAGKIRFSSTRFCGDGDVADYHDGHPATKFYDASRPDTNIVVGYWVSPEGALDTSAGKFFSVGYATSSKIDSDVTEKLLTPHFSDQPTRQTFEIIKDAMKDMANVAEATKFATVAGNLTTKYNMKFVAMVCPQIQNDVGVNSTTGMSSLKINRQFINGTNLVGMTNLKEYMHDNILDGNGSISKTRVNVNSAGSGNYAKSIDLQFSNGGGGQSLSYELTSLVNDLANTPKPSVTSVSITLGVSPTISCSCDKLSYHDDMSSIRSRIDAIKSRIDQAKNDKNICDVSSTIRFDSNDYPWEVFRTNAACQMYHKMIAEELSALENAYASLFDDPALNKNTCSSVNMSIPYTSCPVSALNLNNISDSEFRQRKVDLNKKIMKIVGTPNAIQVAQEHLKTQIASKSPNFALNKTACFPETAGNGQYIESIASSVGIQIAPNPALPGSMILSIDKSSVVHPEGNFAIGGYASYAGDAGNKLALFNNTGGDPKLDSSFKVEMGMSSFITVTTGVANVMFHIRSIGCSQNLYCLNDK